MNKQQLIDQIIEEFKNEFEPDQFTIAVLPWLRKKIPAAYDKGREDGFLEGFDNCKAMVERGEHIECCVIPGKLNKA